MANLGTIWAELGLRLTKFDQGLREAEAKIKQAEKSLEGLQKASQRVSDAGKTLTLGITLPLVAAGGAAVKFAMDAVESENLFEVSMGNMADAARAWSEELSDALGLNEYELRKNIGTFNVMLQSMGFGEQAAFGMAKGLTQLTYDMASFYNLKPEEAFIKLQAAISGEIEPLKRLGIVVNETTIQTYAYTHGIAKQGAELTEQQKILARYGVIMEATQKAQGDLARTIDSPTNKLRVFTERVKEVSVDIGMMLIPWFEKGIDVVSRVVTWFSKLDQGTQKTIITIAGIAAAVGPALMIMGKLGQAVVSLSSAKTVLADSVIAKKLIPMIGSLGKALLGLAANPVALTVAAIAGLVTVAIYVWRNWDEIKPKLLAIWELIRAGAESVSIKIGQAWNSVKQVVYGVINSILDAVAPLLEWLPGRLGDSFENMRKAAKQKLEDVGNNFERLSERAEENERRLAESLNRVGEEFRRADENTKTATSDMAVSTANAASSMSYDFNKLGIDLAALGSSFAAADTKASKAAADARAAWEIACDKINMASEILRAEYDLTIARMGDTATESEKLAAQLQYQQAELENARQRVAVLQAEYDRLRATKGETAEETKKLYLELMRAKVAEEELKNAINETNSEIVKQAQAAREAEIALMRYFATASAPESVKKKGKEAEREWERSAARQEAFTMAMSAEQREFVKRYGREPTGSELRTIADSVKTKLNLIGLQHGGIVTKPLLALLAERGPEAVVPLDRSDAVIDYRKLADAVAQAVSRRPQILQAEVHVHAGDVDEVRKIMTLFERLPQVARAMGV